MAKQQAIAILNSQAGLIAFNPAERDQPAEVRLDGWFRQDVLSAMTWWMRNHPDEDWWTDPADGSAIQPAALHVYPTCSSTVSVTEAIDVLFRDFQTRPRPESAWVHRILSIPKPSRAEIECEIRQACAHFCPDLPAENVPPLIETLMAALHALQRASRIERVAG